MGRQGLSLRKPTKKHGGGSRMGKGQGKYRAVLNKITGSRRRRRSKIGGGLDTSDKEKTTTTVSKTGVVARAIQTKEPGESQLARRDRGGEKKKNWKK